MDPDGSHILFDDRSTIKLIDADGSRLQTVVDANPGYVLSYGVHADISPDGSRIVYTSCQYPTVGLQLLGRRNNTTTRL